MLERLVAMVSWFHHLDGHISWLLQQFPGYAYFFLSVAVFLENGVIFTPFLPGDSLIFVCGSFAAKGALDPWVLFASLSISAAVGSTFNYAVGRFCKPYLATGSLRLIKPDHIARTEMFFKRYGALTIGIAKFLPILRTFAPFLAGVGDMGYSHFMIYNIVGSVVWIGFFVLTGYYFGTLPIVADHLGAIIMGIFAISLAPILIQFFKPKGR